MKAFVLVSLAGTNERETLELMKSMPEVQNAYLVFGEWDIVVEVDTENPEALSAFVLDKVTTNPNVKLTSSLIVAGK
jgi:anthranilate phosphoribosyltransferase